MTEKATKILEISIVTSLYNSEKTLEDFLQAYSKSCKKLVGDKYEIILVNDGSPDRSLEQATHLKEQFKNVRIIDLSRNYGQHPALFEGLCWARGEYVYICDSDMEETPELLEAYWTELQDNPDLDLVGGYLEKRERRGLPDMAARLAWKAISLLGNQPTQYVRNLITARLFRKRVAEALRQFGEQNLFIATVFSTVGFRQKFLPIRKPQKTETSYSLSRKIRLLLDGLLSHGSFVGWVSVLCSFFFMVFSILMFVYTASRWFIGVSIDGWLSIMGFLSISMAILFGMLALHGILLQRTLNEARGRPRTIVRDVIDGDGIN